MSTVTEQRVFGLDVLRAVAILSVLICHAAPFFTERGPRLEASLLYLGYLGVELFFVLSGYLIARIVIRSLEHDGSWSALRSFWIRRWFRTIPTYFLFLAINLLIAAWLGLHFQDLWRYLFFFQHALENTSFFSESWSLAVEEWFYILFPLLIWTVFRFRNSRSTSLDKRELARRFFATVGVFVLSAVALRCLLVATLDPSWDAEARRTLLYRLDAPGYGVLAAGLHVFYKEWWEKHRALSSAVAMTLFFTSVAYFFGSTERELNQSFFARALYFPVTSISVMCMLPVLSHWTHSAGTIARITTKISLWSYSLYLCQLPLRSLLLSGFDAAPMSSLSAWIPVVLYVTGSVAISALCFQYFEKPITSLREKWS